MMHLLWYQLLTDTERAFVGLGLPFCRKSDSVIFLSKISFKTPVVTTLQ